MPSRPEVVELAVAKADGNDPLAACEALVRALATAVTPAEVAEAFVRQAAPAVGARGGWVALRDAEELVRLAHHDVDGTTAASYGRIALAKPFPACRVVQTGTAEWLGGLAQMREAFAGVADEATLQAVERIGKAWAVLPLASVGSPFGVAVLHFAEEQVFAEGERRLIATMAAMCAQALERAVSSARLGERESFYRKLMDAMTDLVTVTDLEGRIVYASPSYSARLGWDPDLLLGQCMMDLLHPDDRPGSVAQGARDLQESGSTRREARVRHADGSYRILEGTGTMLMHEGRPHILGVGRDVTKRRTLEREQQRLLEDLDHERAKLSAILDQMPIGVCIAEVPSGRLAVCNAGMERIWRAPPTQMASADAYGGIEAYHPDGRRVTAAEWPLARAVQEGVDVPAQPFEVVRPDGSRAKLLVRARPVHSSDGATIAAVALVEDVTEALEAERRLFEANSSLAHAHDRQRSLVGELEVERARLHAVLQRMPAGVAIAEAPSGRVLLANNQVRAMLRSGSRGLELGAERGWSAVRPDGSKYAPHEFPLARALRDGEEVTQEEMVLVRPDGTQASVQASAAPVRDASGRTVAAVLVLHDITELRARQEQLRRMNEELEASSRNAQQLLEDLGRQRAFLSSLLAQLPSGVVIAEAPSGRLILSNSQLAGIWRKQVRPTNSVSEYAVGVGFRADGSRVQAQEWPLARALLAGEHVLGEEIEIERADGTRAFVSMNAAPIHDEAGRLVAAAAVVNDITESRRQRAQLEAANAKLEEAARRKSMLLNAVAHELRTPLTPIMLQLELLQGARSEAARQKGLALLERNLSRLARLVAQLTDVTGAESGRLPVRRRRIDVCEVVREAAETYREAASTAGVDLEVHAPGPIEADADPDRVVQVLVNFLGNALKFTPAGGQVRVEAAMEGGQVRVEVQDTGAGFDAQGRERLFQPFSRLHDDRHGRGSGLGLYLSRAFIEQHGGTVGADSAGPGKGARFWFTLPLVAASGGGTA